MNSPPLGRTQSWRNRIDSRIGNVVAGRYRLGEVLATGGIGAVYSAEDLVSCRRVVVKLLFPETEGFHVLAARMEREGLVGQRLDHRNLVKALDCGTTEDGGRYVVTELVRGRTLRELMKDGALPVDRAIGLIIQLLEALRAAHSLGVLHRDLKPRNIIVDEESADHLTLIDFGLARVPSQLIGDEATEQQTLDELSTQQQLTTSGIVFGTLAYMAPETALGMNAVDARSDLYAVGVLFYELIAGKHPFAVTDPVELFLHHRVVEPPPFAVRAPEVAVPAPIQAVILRLLAKRPVERFASASQVLAALRAARALREAPARETLRTASSLQNAVITIAPTSLALGSSAGLEGERDSMDRAVRAMRGSGKLPRVALIIAGLCAAFAWMGMRDRSSAREAPPPSLQVRGPLQVQPLTPVAPPASAERDAARIRFRTNVELARWQTAANALRQAIELDQRAIGPPTLDDAGDRERALAVGLRAAFGQLADVDLLFDTLAERAGPGGIDVLYAMVESQGGSRGAALAWERLTRPEVRARLSPALASALALREASCRKKPELFERAGADGDVRTLRVLELLRPPRCDARRGECCLPEHDGLKHAMSAIEEREAGDDAPGR